MHVHILPGLDDGPKDMTGSIAMARCYQSAGIRTVVATPHFLPGTAWAHGKEKVLQAVQALQTCLDEENIDLKIHAGMEIAFHKKLEVRILAGDLLPLADSDYFLVEPSMQGEQESLFIAVQSLLDKGIKLIMAHPERIDVFQKMPDLLLALIKQGMKIQINAGSLLGYFGSKSRETAESLCRENCVHLIASDAHDHNKHRAPLNVTEWQALLSGPGGREILSSCIGFAKKFHAAMG